MEVGVGVKWENDIWEFCLCLKVINKSWHVAQPCWQDLNKLSIISLGFLTPLEFTGLHGECCIQKSSCNYSILCQGPAASISRKWTCGKTRKCNVQCLSKERVAFRVSFFVAATEPLFQKLGPHIPNSPVPKTAFYRAELLNCPHVFLQQKHKYSWAAI